MTENEISNKVIGIAIELHKKLGSGLLESVYENALAYDLKEVGLKVIQQISMPFEYKDVKLDVGYRLDLLVENKLIIEIKSVEALAPVHFVQLLTYLKLSDLNLGMLIILISNYLRMVSIESQINYKPSRTLRETKSRRKNVQKKNMERKIT